MRISCPGCSISCEGIDPGPDGCMLQCSQCGTQWMARRYTENPYARADLGPDEADAASETMVEHRGAGFGESDHVAVQPGRSRSELMQRSWGKVAAAALFVIAAVMMARVPIVAAFTDRAEVGGIMVRDDLLEFRRIRSERDIAGGTNRLVVVGEIVNPSRNDLSLPSVRVALLNKGGVELRSWRVDLARSEIGAGETIGFRSALTTAPTEAARVNLTLAPRLDVVAGQR